MTRIGVLSPATGGFYFGEVLAGIVHAAAASGASVTLLQTLDAGQTGDEFIPPPSVGAHVGWDRLDGAVTIAWAADEDSVRSLVDRGVPTVLVSNDMDVDAASVVIDNRTGVRTGVHHLAGHGHTRIAFVGNLAQSDMNERYLAYLEAVAELGLDPEGVLVPTLDHTEAGGAAAAEAVAQARRTRGITAAIVSTDRVALGLMAELGTYGVRVPEDLALIGFDDIEPGWTSSPPLSTVDQRFADQGAAAVELLLAELRGDAVEHVRHTMPATFVQRRSCGCAAGEATGSADAARDARVVVDAVMDVLGVDPDADDAATVSQALGRVDLGRLSHTLEDAVATLGHGLASPEELAQFTRALVADLGDLGRRLHAAGLPGAEVLDRTIAQTSAAVAQVQAAEHLERVTRLALSLGDQYELGMGMLGTMEDDPRTLGWLDQVSVRTGCLALWDGEPGSGVLRIAGVYDPDRRLPDLHGQVLEVEQFPPAEVIDCADSTRDEVAYVIPVRGASGDHGFFCVVGPVDTEFGTGRATYNHWASLLGVALRERALLEEVRRSEMRHAHAARATHDGLWELDLRTRELYLSDRCREILGLEPGDGQDAWEQAIVPENRALVADTMATAARDSGTPTVEIEYRVRHADGERWVLSRALGVAAGGRVERLVGSLSDIHPRKVLEDQLRQGAFFDPVTGLPNRRHFRDRLAHALDLAGRRPDSRFAVVFLDLDGFKLINDSLGHLMGDELLATVGRRLQADLRAVDTAARFGGDEFAVLLSDPVPQEVLVIAQRIQEHIAEPVLLGETEVQVTASVGITTSEAGYTSAEDVLRDADTAMYHAKGTERGTASVFDPDMHARATGRLRARSELRAALAEEQFVVHYQPVVALDGAAVRHVEALVRWDHPERGLLLPGAFLPDMEDNGSVLALGRWLIDRVCAQLAVWTVEHPEGVTVAVNLSHREFWSEDLLATLDGALSRHGVPAAALVLEITESVIMTDPATARERMSTLREMGFALHIDDFGTGHSSLGALRTFPVDALKIDGSFIRDLETDVQTSELVRIIVAMGATLGMDVVAECVETAAQAEHLTTLGCHNAQGWLYARALPAEQVGDVLGRPMADVPWPHVAVLAGAPAGPGSPGGDED